MGIEFWLYVCDTRIALILGETSSACHKLLSKNRSVLYMTDVVDLLLRRTYLK